MHRHHPATPVAAALLPGYLIHESEYHRLQRLRSAAELLAGLADQAGDAITLANVAAVATYLRDDVEALIAQAYYIPQQPADGAE